MSEWKWEPNITVSVWGRGKATNDNKEQCGLNDSDLYIAKTFDEAGMSDSRGPRYKGDCDNCQYFRGCDTTSARETVYWGTRFKGCCAMLLDSIQPTKPHINSVSDANKDVTGE